ncbi:MAG TPA: PhzF family phenazine biosynthesis protein [Vicinamibacteria bacterium]|nr:PhzF family phenazine biosynthesis protein [Vicinamibacteria bacterium]
MTLRIPIFQVDAFTGRVFAGNPAAVCPLRSWLDDATMQAIAAENNLSETAFFVSGKQHHELRWFTPTVEVDLCGHATLASAFVIFRFLDPKQQVAAFESKSGPLRVARSGDLLVLDFPSRPAERCDAPPALGEGLRAAPREVWRARDNYMAVYETEEEVRRLRPDMALLRTMAGFGVVVTAPGQVADFVSRYFAPSFGIDEDPVTGMTHCTLTPYWAQRLGKERLHALQVSARGGELFCMPRGDRVAIAGRAVRYMQGVIEV